MAEACTFENKGRLYFYRNVNNESTRIFRERCRFKVFMADTFSDSTGVSTDTLSHFWANIKHLGVQYDQKIMDLFKQCSSP